MGAGEIMDKPEGFIPDDQFVPDPPKQESGSQEQSQPAGFIPDDQFVPDAPEDHPGFISDKDFKSDEDKYGTPLQQAGTVAEGLAQGIAGPLATAAELGLSKLGVPGMSAEDIKGRAETNPTEHGLAQVAGFAAGLFTGASEAKLAAGVAEHLVPEAMGRIGAAALNGAIQSGIFAGSDEITKAMIGQGNPEHPVAGAIANVGAAGLLGAATGGAFGTLGKGVQKLGEYLEKSNFSTKAAQFLQGVGLGSSLTPEQLPEYLKMAEHASTPEWTKKGLKTFELLQSKAAGYAEGALLGQLTSNKDDSTTERLAKMAVFGFLGSKVNSYAARKFAPVLYKILGNGHPEGIAESLSYWMKAQRGESQMVKGVESLFDYGNSKAIEFLDPGKDNELLDKYIKDGGINTQIQKENQAIPQEPGFAHGGDVTPPVTKADGIAKHFPEQNILINSAKARVSNYLQANQPRPLNNKLAFDNTHKDPNSEHVYNRLLTLANQPLRVLNHVKDGSLLPQHVDALKSMYPELHGQLSKKMMEKVVDKVHKGEKPPYHVRQSLSLFMGQDLDSSLTPASIQAAQNVFAQKQQNVPEKANPALSKLGKASMTDDQAREKRMNKD